MTSFTVPFEITVPDGWASIGWGVLKEEAGEWLVVFVNFVSPRYVPTDACAWNGAIVEVDPSPEAFVAAMTAQASPATTPPVEVVVGDYSGLEFDYSVESDVDVTECYEDFICLSSELPHHCTRRFYAVSQRETERALDLNGELAVIAVDESRSVDPALTEEARAVFDSIVFVADE